MTAEASIAAGKLRPVAWSPASSLWGRLLNFEADREYVADDNPSIVRTPLVIAMWEPLARALGWPRKQVGFQQILDLALDPRGWATYGKPQFGRFKLGHTNPDFSTSGLSAVAAEYYSATGKREGLTEADISKPKVRREIKAIERSIVHYGDTTLFFSDQLKRFGPAYASAVAMEEVTLVDFNRSRRGDKLVGLYPAGGTFFSDNPFIVLGAPWVSARQRAGAEAFQRWLAKEVTPERASRSGFRPGDPDAKAGAPVDAAHGADPAAAEARPLPPPAPRPGPDQGVVARGPQAGQRDARRRHVGLDERGGKARPGQAGTAAVPAPARPVRPGGHVHVQRPGHARPSRSAPFSANRARLLSAVDDLFPDGETAVYDATDRGFKAIRGLRDDARINAVVVLTDGEDNQSRMSDREVVAELARQSRSEGLAVRVYTIAYGSQANKDVLADIANASGGKPFEGDPKEIESVYRSISSFF